jgi:hypothetical protein
MAFVHYVLNNKRERKIMLNPVTTLVRAQEESFSFLPRTFEEAEKYATIIANSAVCPKNFAGRPGDILVILQMGHELKLKPMQSLRTLGCINGIPFAYGDGLLALVKRHSDFVDIKEWSEGDYNLGTLIAYCTVTRKNQQPQTRSFSIDDAKRAGLLGKSGPWTQYPKRMLQHRARTFACRDVFPDALFGLMSEDEARGINTPVAVEKPAGKGMQGFRESIGLTPAPKEIIEGNAEIVIENSKEMTKLEELKELMSRLAVSETSIAVTLKKFGVENLESLSEQQIDKWSKHLKSKDKKND